MFFTYLRRELRRRRRQAAIIALGLALGIGLVVTVSALSGGVSRAQGEVLRSLYGQDTAITVTKEPKFGSGGPGGGFRFPDGGSQPSAGSTVKVDNLTSTGLGTIAASDVATVAKLNGVAAAAGGLTLNDTKLSFTIPSQGGSGGGGTPGGGFGSGRLPNPISVNGVAVSGNAAALGPLSTAKLVSGRTLAGSDANADVALVSSSYATAHKLSAGSTVTLAKTSFKIVGVVSAGSGNSTDVYIPLARAQALGTAQGKSLKGQVNTIYVAASSATSITTVSKEISAALPGTTVTNQNNLAKQLTGSVASASSLASNLGKWLAIAVLAAAFALASLLTTAAVSRRVREFGTLKALGWTSRRIVRQVVGESLVIGVDRRRSRDRARVRGIRPGRAVRPHADRIGRADHGHRHPRRSQVVRRPARRLRRRRGIPATRHGSHPHGARAADGDGHHRRGRRGRHPGRRRRPARGRVRRLARRPTASGGGAGQGRMNWPATGGQGVTTVRTGEA